MGWRMEDDLTTGPVEKTPAGLQWAEKPSHPLTAEIFAYWLSKRESSLIPPRRAIDPIEIPKLLPHIVILDDLTEDGDFRIRLYGSEVAFWTGEDRTGARSADLGRNRPENLARMTQERWRRVVQRVLQEKEPLFLRTRMTPHEKDYAQVHVAALPLSGSDPDSIEQILGVLVRLTD